MTKQSFLNSILKNYSPSGDISKDIVSFLTLHHCNNTAAHCLQVGAKAKVLAKRFGEDPKAAEISGWLHDVSAVVPSNKRVEVSTYFGIKLLKEELEFPMILHQKLSAVFGNEIFNINDQSILNAVACHTTLKAAASNLDKILFIADKIAWDQKGIPPYLDELNCGLEISLDAGVFAYIDHLWQRKKQLAVVHPWLKDAYLELSEILNQQ